MNKMMVQQATTSIKEDIEIIGDYLLEMNFALTLKMLMHFINMPDEWKEHIMNEMNVADQMKVSKKASSSYLKVDMIIQLFIN